MYHIDCQVGQLYGYLNINCIYSRRVIYFVLFIMCALRNSLILT